MKNETNMLFSSCMYEDIILLLHAAGFSTLIESVNESAVFKISITDDYTFKYAYVGNFKVLNSEMILYPALPNGQMLLKIDDLSDPRIYHRILGYFGKPMAEIDDLLRIKKKFDAMMQ